MSIPLTWQVDIEKTLANESWTNVYYMKAPDQQTAVNQGGVVAAIEALIHHPDVTISRLRVRQAGIKGYFGTMQELAIPGTAGQGGLMPLFVCMRVVFNQAASKPSVKYLRGCVREINTANRFEHTQGALDFIQTTYCGALAALGYLCGADGLPFTSIKPSKKIAEHQLRRGSKKKPVLG